METVLRVFWLCLDGYLFNTSTTAIFILSVVFVAVL